MKVLFGRSDDTDFLYIFGGNVPTGPCGAPVHKPLEQGKRSHHGVGVSVN